ncbi:MAG: 2Fe-2S iron-sulfur cluster-binding protein [Pseudomonadota bacterium]
MATETFKITLTNRDGAVVECRSDEPIYDACLRAGYQLPIACEYGGCMTCAAKMISGKVRQPGGTALNKRQSKMGFILLCVAYPKADCVLEVGVESHTDLYQNPFAAKTHGVQLARRR